MYLEQIQCRNVSMQITCLLLLLHWINLYSVLDCIVLAFRIRHSQLTQLLLIMSNGSQRAQFRKISNLQNSLWINSKYHLLSIILFNSL